MHMVQHIQKARVAAQRTLGKATKAYDRLRKQAEVLASKMEAVKQDQKRAQEFLRSTEDILKGASQDEAKAGPKATKAKPGPKPGPKPKVVKAKPGPKPKAKPGPKPKAKPGPKPKASNRAAGRRAVASGERPSLRNAIIQVMGSKVMNRQQVFDALKEKGWLPNSNDPIGYVGYTLSAMKTKDGKHLFERPADKGKGWYRVRSSDATEKAAAEKPAADKPPVAKAKPGRKPKAAAPSNENSESTADVLKSIGIGDANSPIFGG